ncbi:MAG: sugar ABC transporter permease [Desulfurococcaceae archaeon]
MEALLNNKLFFHNSQSLRGRNMGSHGSLPLTIVFIASLATAFFFIYGLIGWNILLSFTKSMGLITSYELTGLTQYVKAGSDPVFQISLKNNLMLIVLFIPGSIGLGLLLAVLLDLVGGRGETLYRTIYLLPFSLSFVTTASMWAWMYNYSYGVVNTLLTALLGRALQINWLGDPNIALYSVILALIWQFSGYTALVFLAGIKSIPESQINAARIDGASAFQLYTRIVIPQLKPWILSAFVVLMVFALKAFDFIYVLTNGGPGVSTYVLALLMFRRAFFETDFPYGAALATILFTMVISVVVPYLLLSSRKGEK